jgi:hypothetical protein
MPKTACDSKIDLITLTQFPNRQHDYLGMRLMGGVTGSPYFFVGM